jgi:uncharacterized protein HemX
MHAIPTFLLILAAIGVAYYIFYQVQKAQFETSLITGRGDQKLDRDQLVKAMTELNDSEFNQLGSEIMNVTGEECQRKWGMDPLEALEVFGEARALRNK